MNDLWNCVVAKELLTRRMRARNSFNISPWMWCILAKVTRIDASLPRLNAAREANGRSRRRSCRFNSSLCRVHQMLGFSFEFVRIMFNVFTSYFNMISLILLMSPCYYLLDFQALFMWLLQLFTRLLQSLNYVLSHSCKDTLQLNMIARERWKCGMSYTY